MYQTVQVLLQVCLPTHLTSVHIYNENHSLGVLHGSLQLSRSTTL